MKVWFTLAAPILPSVPVGSQQGGAVQACRSWVFVCFCFFLNAKLQSEHSNCSYSACGWGWKKWSFFSLYEPEFSHWATGFIFGQKRIRGLHNRTGSQGEGPGGEKSRICLNLSRPAPALELTPGQVSWPPSRTITDGRDPKYKAVTLLSGAVCSRQPAHRMGQTHHVAPRRRGKAIWGVCSLPSQLRTVELRQSWKTEWSPSPPGTTSPHTSLRSDIPARGPTTRCYTISQVSPACLPSPLPPHTLGSGLGWGLTQPVRWPSFERNWEEKPLETYLTSPCLRPAPWELSFMTPQQHDILLGPIWHTHTDTLTAPHKKGTLKKMWRPISSASTTDENQENAPNFPEPPSPLFRRGIVAELTELV